MCLVGVLWGGTNPFLKIATNKVKKNKQFNFISEVTSHLSNWNVSSTLKHLDSYKTVQIYKCVLYILVLGTISYQPVWFFIILFHSQILR